MRLVQDVLRGLQRLFEMGEKADSAFLSSPRCLTEDVGKQLTPSILSGGRFRGVFTSGNGAAVTYGKSTSLTLLLPVTEEW